MLKRLQSIAMRVCFLYTRAGAGACTPNASPCAHVYTPPPYRMALGFDGLLEHGGQQVVLFAPAAAVEHVWSAPLPDITRRPHRCLSPAPVMPPRPSYTVSSGARS